MFFALLFSIVQMAPVSARSNSLSQTFEYYIRLTASDKFISTHLAPIAQQATFNGRDIQRWKLIKNSDGTYYIQSSAGYLTVDTEAVSDASSIAIQPLSGGIYQKWILTQVNGYNLYTIVNKGSGKTIAPLVSYRLGQRTATDEDVFSIELASLAKGVLVGGVDHPEKTPASDRKDFFGDLPRDDTVLDPLYDIYKSHVFTNERVRIADFQQALTFMNMVMIAAHGDQTHMTLYGNECGSDIQSYYVGDILCYPDGSYPLCDLRCLVLLVCQSGQMKEEGDWNLANQFHAAGAKTVVSFEDELITDGSNDWEREFARQCALGRTVEQAVQLANQKYIQNAPERQGDGYQNYYIAGCKTQTVNQ